MYGDYKASADWCFAAAGRSSWPAASRWVWPSRGSAHGDGAGRSRRGDPQSAARRVGRELGAEHPQRSVPRTGRMGIAGPGAGDAHRHVLRSPARAPITLLELGLFARSGKLIVCCPDGYWRKGNIEVVSPGTTCRWSKDLAGLIAEWDGERACADPQARRGWLQGGARYRRSRLVRGEARRGSQCNPKTTCPAAVAGAAPPP